MKATEVLGVELRQYHGKNLKTLVPGVIGMTSDAQKAKSQRPASRVWDEQSFLHEIQERVDGQTKDMAVRILDWARSKDLPIKWGRGGSVGTFYPVISTPEGTCNLFGVSTEGKIEVTFSYLLFSSDEQRAQLLQRLNRIPGVSFRESAVRSWGSFPMSALHDPDHLKQFFETFEWAVTHLFNL